MSLVVFLQGLSSVFLTTIASVFEFMGQLPFFVFLFAIFYLMVNKETAYKFWVSYASGFIFGSLFLKNIVKRPRPYQDNSSLLATRNNYSYSFPSASSILVSQNVTYVAIGSFKNTNKNINKILLVCVLIIVVALTSLSQIYFAKNYLLDVIIGALLGLIISLLVYKFFEINKNTYKIFAIVGIPLLLILTLYFSNQLFTNDFSNSVIINFSGLSIAVILGCYIENKYINYEVKNNLIFTTFKVLITTITLIAYYYLSLFLLSGMLILSFIKYFVAGIIITLLLPMLFKKLENYFYLYSKDVNKKNVICSHVTLSCKGTKKVAEKIFKNLKNGDVVLLSGDLGAGKSVLVRNMLSYAGVKKAITSPTFTLVNEYNTSTNHFYHFDMYRLEEDDEVVNIGFEEILDDSNSIKFIEWPEKVVNYLPKKYKKITIVKLGNHARNIILEEYN